MLEAYRASFAGTGEHKYISLRVQVSDNHILTQNQYYRFSYPNPRYLIILYMDPLGISSMYLVPLRLMSLAAPSREARGGMLGTGHGAHAMMIESMLLTRSSQH